MARVYIIIFLTGLILTCINIVVWNQLVQLPSNDVQSSSACDCSATQSYHATNHLITNATPSVASTAALKTQPPPPSHRLSVVVPFRDRFEEMLEFVPHIHAFLNRQKVFHEIWIINQVDSHRYEIY